VALSRRGALSVAHALAAWRFVCYLLVAKVQLQSHDTRASLLVEELKLRDKRISHSDKEIRAMALRVTELEAQDCIQRQSADVLQAMPRARPPMSPAASSFLPSSKSTGALLQTSDALGSRSSSSSRHTSPRPAPRPELVGELEEAIVAVNSRSASPKATLAEQLEHAVGARARRQATQVKHDETLPPEAAFCTFCGNPADKNVVRCSSCYRTVFHIRCLTSAQAARFKGRSWQCDACLMSRE